MKKLIDKFLLIFRDPKVITCREKVWTIIFAGILFLAFNLISIATVLKANGLQGFLLFIVIFFLAFINVLLVACLYVDYKAWDKHCIGKTQ